VPFVLTVDQIQSRAQQDLVEVTLAGLGQVDTMLPFTRTVGDEFQGLLVNAASVVDVTLSLMRTLAWHIGIGIGAVQQPLPSDARQARGPAFLAARGAVEAAKKELTHLSVRSEPDRVEVRDVEATFRLLIALQQRRSPQGWEAAELMDQGLTQAAAASTLAITRQALSQRLQAAHWSLDREARPVLARLLTRAERATTPDSPSELRA
jgi:SatD family (SatD)